MPHHGTRRKVGAISPYGLPNPGFEPMSLRGPGRTRRRFFAGSMVIVLAIAILGLAGGQHAAAQFDGRLLELLKKKGGSTNVDPKKAKLTNVLSGKKDVGKTAVEQKSRAT